MRSQEPIINTGEAKDLNTEITVDCEICGSKSIITFTRNIDRNKSTDTDTRYIGYKVTGSVCECVKNRIVLK